MPRLGGAASRRPDDGGENLGDHSFRYSVEEFGEMAVIAAKTDRSGQMPCTCKCENGRLHFFDEDGNRVLTEMAGRY